MENKRYKINTVKELSKTVTKENIDRFLIDFTTILRDFCEMKEVLTEQEKENFYLDRFTWIDDGKNDINYDFRSKLD